MVAKIAELVGFDFVFLGLGIVDVAFTGAVSPRAFHDALFAEKICRLDRIGFVGGAKDEPVTEIQGQHLRFVIAQRWHKRGGALRGGDDRGAGLADHVHAVVVARAVFARGHESLRFVGPEDQQVVLRTLGFRTVEPAQRVIVVQELQVRVQVTPLGLEFLRHGHEDDLALVNRVEIERGFSRAEHLGDFGCQKVLQVVADGLADTTELFIGLSEETVGKVCMEGGAPGCLQQILEVLHLLLQQVAAGQYLVRADQRNRAVQLEQQFQRVGDVGLRLALEESLVPALSETRGGVHDELGVGRKGNAAVTGQTVPVRRCPRGVRVVTADLQVDQVVFAPIVACHRRERFPVNAFLVNAQAAPCRLVLKDLVGKLVDAGTRLAGASVTGDEPATTELIAFPDQPSESRHALLTLARPKQQPCRHAGQ